MPREQWWMPHDRHFEAVNRPDAELEAAADVAFAIEAETWFSKEGVRDCV